MGRFVSVRVSALHGMECKGSALHCKGFEEEKNGVST